MTEISRILDQLDRSMEGDAWHGPSLRELLKGVTARQANSKSSPGIHSIWEIVLHITADQDVARRRLAGETIIELPPELDWPPIPDNTETAWQQTINCLVESKQKLRQSISQMSDERLEEIVPGKGYSAYVLLHGVIQHNLYHAGQIAILKKFAPS
ncbi:MAG TPA: DinB family protein [Gemmataceae bacterium]|jgi:uncharacterized damage-inducible protein DinB|nr:DinB family protein [Gemmataceae bacterium]